MVEPRGSSTRFSPRGFSLRYPHFTPNLNVSFITFQMERTVFGARPFRFFDDRPNERSHSSTAARTAGFSNSRTRYVSHRGHTPFVEHQLVGLRTVIGDWRRAVLRTANRDREARTKHLVDVAVDQAAHRGAFVVVDFRIRGETQMLGCAFRRAAGWILIEAITAIHLASLITLSGIALSGVAKISSW